MYSLKKNYSFILPEEPLLLRTLLSKIQISPKVTDFRNHIIKFSLRIGDIKRPPLHNYLCSELHNQSAFQRYQNYKCTKKHLYFPILFSNFLSQQLVQFRTCSERFIKKNTCKILKSQYRLSFVIISFNFCTIYIRIFCVKISIFQKFVNLLENYLKQS